MLLFGLLIMGCTDESYVGWVEDYYDFQTEIAVQVAVGDPDAGVTKGSGVKDELNDFAGKNIRVFAFNRDAGTNFSRDNDPLSCLIYGREAYLDGQIAYASWQNAAGESEAIFYPNGEDCYVAYDFYACFLDDLRPSGINATPDKISYEIEIDGARDLMTSVAEHPAPIQPADTTAKEQPDYSFSYYTAQRGIIPVFRMHHDLVRLDFEVKPGYTPGEVRNVHIDSLFVKSVTRGSMTVAAKDTAQIGIVFHEGGTRSALYLCERDGSRFQRDSIRTAATPDRVVPGRYLNGSLFVAPDNSYPLRVSLSEDEVNNGRPQHTDKVIAFDGGFEAGHRYKITMEIFGAAHVDFSVELVDWNDGGNIIWDPDPRPM